MNGILLGGIALALVLLVVITRPLLARIGASYAFARPRHSVFIVIGLMVAGSVVVSAGLVGDSASENTMEALLSRTEYGDGVITASNPRNMVLQQDAERALANPALDGMLEARSTGIRATMPLDSLATGRGDDETVVWGVDPGEHRPLQNADVIAGTIPASLTQWGDDEVILTRNLAASLGADLGDELTLYLPLADTRVPPPPINAGGIGFTGVLYFATQNPVDESYVHSPLNDYQTPFLLPPGTFQLEITLNQTDGSDTELVVHLIHEEELHSEHLMETPGGHISLEQVPEGNWSLEVHSPLANSVGFSGQIEFRYRDPDYVVPSAEPITLPLTVRALIDDRGSDLLTNRGVAFLPLPTLQTLYDAPGRVNSAFVVATPGTNIDLFDERLRHVVQNNWPGTASPSVYVPLAGIEELLQQIRLETQIFFLSSSMFTFLAGLLLIVVIMALLAEERKTTIATMRALGAKRWAVTRMYIVEGAVYAGAAAVVAVLMATLLLFALRRPLGNMYPGMDGFNLHWSPMTIIASMGIAFALTIATIAIAAHRATRLDPVQAMRGEENEDKGTRGTGLLAGSVVTLLGAVLSISLLAAGNALLLLLGPTLIAVGLVLVARRFTRQTWPLTVAAMFVLLFSAWRLSQIDTYGGLMDFLVLPVGAVLLGLSAAALFVHARSLHSGIVALSARVRGLGPVVDTALSHLRARPGRAFLTISMLATVLVVITVMGTMVTTFAPSGYEESGGFAVMGDSHHNLGDPVQYLQEHPPRSGIDPFPLAADWTYTPWVHQDGYLMEIAPNTYTSIQYQGMVDRSVIGATPAFIDAARFRSATVAPEYADLDAALHAVAADPGLVVMSDRAQYWPDTRSLGAEPQRIQVDDRIQTGRGDEELRVVALIHDLDGAGSIAHPDVVAYFSERRGFPDSGTRIWANPASGTSDDELAGALESAFRSAGLTATLVSDPYPEWSAVDRSFTLVFMVFLSLGLVIGLVALGLVTVRNTMVRRREIGVMRAVGGRPYQVLLVFAVEALYIMIAAIAIGLVGGLWTVWSLLRGDDFMTLQDDALFVADPVLLGSIYAVTLVAGLITALASSWHAAKIPPAEAVRYVE